MAPSRERGLRFARRIRGLRIVGLAAGMLVVAGVFYENGAHPALWVLLALNAFAWPQLAWRLAHRSPDPYAAERRNLVFDSASGGVWIVLMQFNLLPSVLLAVMLTMDKIGIGGGGRFMAKCVGAMIAAGLAAGLATGFAASPVTTMPMIIACLPLLVTYPLLVGLSTHQLAMRVRDQNLMLAELSRIDGLTGLLNRAHWEEIVASEFSRRKRSGQPATLLMLDIDNFKEVNDRHGHLAGDEVLRGIAKILRATMRQSDAAGRFGGEEFGVLLPDTPLAGALAIAERIRVGVDGARFGAGRRLACSVSIGAAPADGAGTYLEWIDKADRALYAAKAAGKNRSIGYEAGAQDAPHSRAA